MNILLISKAPIIKQIFTLVSKRLQYSLTISLENVEDKQFDLIIYDDEVIISSNAKYTGIITKNKTANSSQCDFVIYKPFLPSTLVSILEEQKVLLSKQSIQDDELNSSLEFIDTLEEENIEDDNLDFNNGGILDHDELLKIQNMLNIEDEDDIIVANNEQFIDDTHDENNDWVDLSQIIDKAIDDIKGYKFNDKEPIKLILNDYSLKEISPLLNKLDQKIVDTLTDGNEVTLKMKVES